MPDKITDLTSLAAGAVDRAADVLEIADVSASQSKKITPNDLMGISGSAVGTTDSQTLTNKTLTSPTISDPTLSGTLSGTYTIGGTPTFPSSIVTLTGTQTLTNKTLTSPTINTATISNPTITVDSIAEYTGANGVSVDGLNIKDGKLNTNSSVVTANITDGAVTPAKLVSGTGSSWGWQSWTPTWTNFTVGNGTVTAKYTQIGKTIICFIKFVAGSTSVFGTNPTFTIPVTAASQYGSQTNTVSISYAEDLATAGYTLGYQFNSSTTAITLYLVPAGGTYLNITTGVNSTTPWTLGSGDYFSTTFIYEAA